MAVPGANFAGKRVGSKGLRGCVTSAGQGLSLVVVVHFLSAVATGTVLQ